MSGAVISDSINKIDFHQRDMRTHAKLVAFRFPGERPESVSRREPSRDLGTEQSKQGEEITC